MSLLKLADALGIDIPKYVKKRGDVAIYARILDDMMKVKTKQAKEIIKTCKSILRDVNPPKRHRAARRRKSPTAAPPPALRVKNEQGARPIPPPPAVRVKNEQGARPRAPPPPPPPPPPPGGVSKRNMLMKNLKKKLKNMGLNPNDKNGKP